MIAPFFRWLHATTPRGDFLAIAVTVSLAIELLYFILIWTGTFPDPELFRTFRFVWLLVSAVSYGSFRASAFHPLLDADYRRWLELSPWRAGKPLPSGPITLVAQDLVLLLALLGLYHELEWRLILFPCAFLVGFQFTSALLLWFTNHWGFAYLIGFGLGTAILFRDKFDILLGLLCVNYGVNLWGINRSLQTFPWKLGWRMECRSFKEAEEQKEKRSLGWPFDALSPESPALLIQKHDGICSSLLLGWLALTLTLVIPMRFEGWMVCLALTSYGMMFGCLFRIGVYVHTCYSPISLLGRISTRRWIIPRFDVIFVAPLLAVLTSGSFITIAILRLVALHVPGNRFKILTPDWQISLLFGTAITFYFLIQFTLGPSVNRWKLVGHHRTVFSPTGNKKLNFIEL